MKAMFISKLIILFLFSTSHFVIVFIECSERPGIRTLLTSKGINYVRKIVVPLIVKELNHLKVPSASGKVDLFVGDLRYNFKNITLSQVKIPNSDVSVRNNAGLLVKGAGLTFKVEELWKYAFRAWFNDDKSDDPIISDTGSCIIAGKDISLKIFVGIEQQGNNEFHVDASKCDLKIGKFDVHFRGRASWLYNFLVSVVKDFVKTDIQNLICKTATKVLNDKLNTALKDIPEETPIFNETIMLNMELTNPPLFKTHGVQLDMKGECYNVDHHVNSSYNASLLPSITLTTPRMIYTWVTSFTLNTLMFSYYNIGPLQRTITEDDIDGYAPLDLNTLAFIFIVPQLYNKYPDKDMVFHLNITEAPQITLHEDEGDLLLVGTMTVLVILDDGSLIDCFTLLVNGHVEINKVYLVQKNNGTYLGCSFSNIQTDVSLKKSNIGDVDLGLLQFTVDVLSQFIVTRYLSAYAREGFKLTFLKGVELYETRSILKKNHILLSADFRL